MTSWLQACFSETRETYFECFVLYIFIICKDWENKLSGSYYVWPLELFVSCLIFTCPVHVSNDKNEV